MKFVEQSGYENCNLLHVLSHKYPCSNTKDKKALVMRNLHLLFVTFSTASSRGIACYVSKLDKRKMWWEHTDVLFFWEEYLFHKKGLCIILRCIINESYWISTCRISLKMHYTKILTICIFINSYYALNHGSNLVINRD